MRPVCCNASEPVRHPFCIGHGMTDILHTDYRSILRLALPVSAGTFMQFLVVLTDNYFLSRTSDVALNGAGNAGVLYITLAMIGAGFCNTGQILIARRMGEGRQDETLRILATGLRVAIVVGTLLILLVALGLNSGFPPCSGTQTRPPSSTISWASGNGATSPPSS